MVVSIRAFASHNWGKEAENHKRVAVVVDLLQKRGIDVWFDEHDMKGNILSAMCKGIDTSQVILIFLTREYVEKVEHGKDTDNVKREFMYAARAPEKLVPILFDSTLASERWSGPVGMVLGSQLYHDMTDPTEDKADELVRIIQKKNGKTMWKYAVSKTTSRLHVIKPVAKTPDFVVVNSAPKTTIKTRVDAAVQLYGSVQGTTTREVIERLHRSVLGTEGEGGLVEQLLRIEAELGLR